jgi:hypothetical protein
MLQVHQLGYYALLPEIVEIEALRLAVFIVRDGQVSDRLSFYRDGLGIAWLFALCFTLRFFSPLFLARPFFLSLSKGCTRASCHSYLLIRVNSLPTDSI